MGGAPQADIDGLPNDAGSVQRSTPEDTPSGPTSRFHLLAFAVLLIGLAVTAALAIGARIDYDHTEQRLLTLDTRLTGSALSSAVASTQSSLETAAELAEATNGNATKFAQLVDADIQTGVWRTVTLWRLTPTPKLIVDVGTRPLAESLPGRLTRIFAQARRSKTFVVADLITRNQLRIGYAVVTRSPGGLLVVYAESVLPANRRLAIQTSSPISDLNYALYLGKQETSPNLLAATPGRLPLPSPTSTVSTPFGSNTFLTLTMSPRISLAGGLASFLPWGIAIAGILFTLLVALMSERLVRRRDRAETLAVLNRRMFQAQRGIAEMLQHSLLPQKLPKPAGFEVAARYLPGVEGVDIGGDWFNVIEQGAGRLFFAVGDVSGRGLPSAALMASLRYAINAYAAEDPEPASVLNRLARLSKLSEHGHFATVLCGLIDAGNRTIVLANAGHPNPILISGGQATLAPTVLDPPIGLGLDDYRSVSLPLLDGDMLVAFTDGLFERRDEPIAEGLERLRRTASGDMRPEALLDHLITTLVPAGTNDDLVILGVKWQS